MTKRIQKVVLAVAALALAGAVGPAKAPNKTPELLSKGKASYETNCATCHGAKGRGDGDAGAVLDPKPRNLVADSFKRGAGVVQVYETLGKGIDGTTMVSFGHLPDDERWALAYYVLDLRGGKAKK